MGDFLVSISGTPAGAQLATVLALVSALAHAVFGALQKGRHDPWLTRGAIDVFLVLFTLPVALFVVPWPSGPLWGLLLGSVVVHFVYKLTVALAYEQAAYTVVYPVIRGTGPVITVIFASLVFQEFFTATQWLGVLLLSGGILGLALRNLSEEKVDPRALKVGLAWALAAGGMVALYTTYYAYGIRTAGDPFTFLAWWFVLTALDFPVLAALRMRRLGIPAGGLRPLAFRGAAGALVAWVSFGGVMLATMLDKVGEAAVLRETSTVFAALIGWFILGERVGPRRLILMTLIALGAVVVDLGG